MNFGVRQFKIRFSTDQEKSKKSNNIKIKENIDERCIIMKIFVS